MFGWFAPRPPLPTGEKVRAERRLARLVDLLGFDRLRDAPVVLPTPEFFPDEFRGDGPSAVRLLHRVCGYMRVDPAAVRLEVRPADDMGKAAGLYLAGRPATIAVADTLLGAPAFLIPVLAHELGHEILLGGNLVSADDPDHEFLTDLVPAALGLGVLSANGTVYDNSWTDGMHGWSLVGKHGYLTARELGYALALFAFARGEDRPAWGRHLRADAAVPFRAGLRYLAKTGDTHFPAGPVRPPTADDLADRLRTGTPGVRLAALWDVADTSGPAPPLLAAVRANIGHADVDVAAGAVAALGAFGPAAAGAVPELVQALWYGLPQVRSEAALALGRVGADPGAVVPALGAVLGDSDSAVVRAATAALGGFGRAAGGCVPGLAGTVAAAVKAGNFEWVNEAVAALWAVAPDVRAAVRAHLPDPEHQRQARLALKELGLS